MTADNRLWRVTWPDKTTSVLESELNAKKRSDAGLPVEKFVRVEAVDLRAITPTQSALYALFYDLAEDARAAGMTEDQIVQCVRDGCSSYDADQSIKEDP